MHGRLLTVYKCVYVCVGYIWSVKLYIWAMDNQGTEEEKKTA